MNCLVEESTDLERFPLSELTSPWDSNILLIYEHFSGLQKYQRALSTANQRNPLACNTIAGNSVTHWKERRFFLPESQSSVHYFCFLKIFISYTVMVDLYSRMQVRLHACGQLLILGQGSWTQLSCIRIWQFAGMLTLYPALTNAFLL